MSRWEVLSGRRERETAKGVHIELATADHEEPTWEVHHPGAPRRPRLDRRTRIILSAAAIAAVAVNAGAAWAYWQVTDSRSDREVTGAPVSVTLSARSDLNDPLRNGGTGNILVTVTNEYDFPIRIRQVAPRPGTVMADQQHRDAGCKAFGVAVTRAAIGVSWSVPRNSVGAFTVPDGVTMHGNDDPRCRGAVYTIPMQGSGYRVDKS